MPREMTFELEQDKTTKRTVRYADASGSHNIYLSKDEARELGNPTKVSLTVKAEPD